MSDPFADDLARAREFNLSADEYIQNLPDSLRIAAVYGGPVSLLITPHCALRLASRLEQAREAKLVVVQPATRGEELIEAFWRRLCGFVAIALIAITAAQAAFALLELVR
ncbi:MULTISPECIES: hypothetical protein [Haematobacter]|uniref:Uncharacterized protein n=1 Tax=Haematobacter massiliensis TaxID=195105 RepID=A0A086Y8U2_9RHOB|nr:MULTISPECIES: hypothetical protein [Haematobacter]KFI30692.1 hypothetical protein CN97_12815 [Haematobacter massiliensis]OWJ70911.1 hypothetical protein CDV50_11290 [Haematobacter massiliensis]OWJ87452.1 hypothetical protein CDV51_06910 [Haematobacter massiliensis]QBJ24905.1 hypothetical protein HmaOT1_12015 [Haematobacter massiliensis]